MFKSAKVQTRINELRAVIRDRFEVSVEDVVRETRAMAFGDRRKLYNENGSLKAMKDLDDDTAKMIAEVTTSQTGLNGEITVTKVKTYNKLAAVEKLTKQLGLYAKDNEQKRSNVLLMTDEQLQEELDRSRKLAGDNNK